MRAVLLIVIFALSSATHAGPVTSLLLNTCGPQAVPPPCAARQHPLGKPVTFWVIARDAQLSLATDYTGTVAITSSDPTAILPPPHVFTVDDNSVYAFSIIFNSVDSGFPSTQTVTATDALDGFTALATFFVVQEQAMPSIPTLSGQLQVLLAAILVALGCRCLRSLALGG